MNFNNQMNPNGQGSARFPNQGQSQYPDQSQSLSQNHHPQAAQNMMRDSQMQLPPQLANLTPDQLQQLRQQPQFQQVLRNYMQKQMLQQQQQQQQRQALGPMPPNAQALAQQRQIPPQMAHQHHIPHPEQSQVPLGAVSSLPDQQMNALNGVPSSIGHGMQALPQAYNPQLARGGRIPLNPGTAVRPSGSGLGVNGVNKPETPTVPIQHFTKHPNVPPEVMSRVKFTPLDTPDTWSKKLNGKGEDVPVDLKVYELMISKDMKFRVRNSRQKELNKKMTDDLLHNARSYNEIKQLRMNAISLSQKGQFNNSIWGEGYQGYGNGITNVATQLVLPHERKQPRRLPMSSKTERESRRQLLDRLMKDPTRHLVPIRLDIGELDNKLKLRDTFLWDLNEQDLKVEEFVHILLDDFKFLDRSIYPQVVKSIKDQIEDYHKRPAEPTGELRIPIRINITVNNTQYTDQFEWDILNFDDNDPEEFSLILCQEMSFPGEIASAIAHLIREQTQLFHKALYIAGYGFDGLAVNEDEIRGHLLPPLRLLSEERGPLYGSLVDEYYSILRNPTSVSDFTPSILKLTQLDVERLDKELERETRHKRRQNNELQSNSGRAASRRAVYAPRGGPTMPDLSDVPKTFRTAQPSSVLPGGVDLGVPEVFSYNEVIVHKTNIPNPEYKAPQSRIQRVVYHNDESSRRFLVKIKLGPSHAQYRGFGQTRNLFV